MEGQLYICDTEGIDPLSFLKELYHCNIYISSSLRKYKVFKIINAVILISNLYMMRISKVFLK